MKKAMGRFKQFLRDRHHAIASLIGFLCLLASLFINFFAGIYATERASNSVTDIILSNTHALNLGGIFAVCSWLLVIAIGVLCFCYPKRMPFIFMTISLFVIIRSLFITLTHIGPFPTADPINLQGFLGYFVFGGDLFFSGHTGLPFLIALIFWDKIALRYLFIGVSIFLGVVVLLAHLHYTIDVLSAYFITYGIYKIAVKIFKEDRQFFSPVVNE